MKSIRTVADVLGRPIAEILLAAGYLTPADVNGQFVSPRTPPTLEDALRLDPDLVANPAKQEAIRQIVEAIDKVSQGKASTVRKSISAPARKRAPRKAG